MIKNEFEKFPIGSKIKYFGVEMMVMDHWAWKVHANGFKERVPCLVVHGKTRGLGVRVEIENLKGVEPLDD